MALWVGCGLFVLFVLLALVLSATREQLESPATHSRFLFLTGLALLAILFPASGPRGRRVGLIAGAGLASLLLLPVWTATLPPLLANTLFALSRDTPSARRGVLTRGLWLTTAMLIAGTAHALLSPLVPLSALRMVITSGLFVGLYASGRQAGLRRYAGTPRGGRMRAWAGWRLEVASLLACAPAAIAMGLLYPTLGVSGLLAAATLMALLLLVAHLGFETAALREQVRAMEKLSAVTVSQTNPHRVADRFLRLSLGLLSCDRASLWLTDDSQTRLERVAQIQHTGTPVRRTDAGSAVRFGEGLIGRVADRRSSLIVRDGARDPRLAAAEETGRASASLLLLPLEAGGETVGVVQFERDMPGRFTARDLTRVRALAIQAAATLANVRRHQDIYNQAVTDGLTGLFNRRHLQTVLVDEQRRAQRYGHPLSVVLLDVDSFKSYNDTYGHPQGDVLLQRVAALLRENVRNVDIVGRYGGEEFIILMPETSQADAWQTAERLRQSVAAADFPGVADDPSSIVSKTISLGIATSPQDATDIQTLVSLADQALYRAKRGGRNRTILAGDAGPAD